MVKKKIKITLEKKIGILLLILWAVLCLVTSLQNQDGTNSTRIYFYIFSIILLILGIYLFLLSPKIKTNEKKIELGILIFSAALIFASFYLSFITSTMQIDNGLNVLGYESVCPENVANDTSFNYQLLNTDTTKGFGVVVRFTGKNICMNTKDGCKTDYSFRPYIIYPAGNITLPIQLNHINNKKEGTFKLETYTNTGWFLPGSTICKVPKTSE